MCNNFQMNIARGIKTERYVMLVFPLDADITKQILSFNRQRSESSLKREILKCIRMCLWTRV